MFRMSLSLSFSIGTNPRAEDVCEDVAELQNGQVKDAHAVDVLKVRRADILVVMIMVTVCNACETFASVQGASVYKLQILLKHTRYIVYVLQSSQWHDLYNNGTGDYNYLE